MNGRRMLWTTLIGAGVAMIARTMNRRRSPMMRMFRRMGRRNNMQWQRLAQPFMQVMRRMAR